MGYIKYLREAWKKPAGAEQRNRLIEWRREPVTVRVVHPTRIDRARSLGYKSKQGVFIVRQRLPRSARMRPQMKAGRRSKNMRRTLILGKSNQSIAEERAGKKYVNCEVLNSYWVGQDGKNMWYEVILVDKEHPSVLRNPQLKGVAKQTRRVSRGLTSAAKRTRGLYNKGKGAEKIRPGQRANSRRAK